MGPFMCKISANNHPTRARGLKFNWDPMGVEECLPGHENQSVGIRGELF